MLIFRGLYYANLNHQITRQCLLSNCCIHNYYNCIVKKSKFLKCFTHKLIYLNCHQPYREQSGFLTYVNEILVKPTHSLYQGKLQELGESQVADSEWTPDMVVSCK